MPVPEDVVRRVRKDFGVELTDAEMTSIETNRDLYYVIERRAVAEERGKPCRSSHMLYQLRRALVDEFGVQRGDVTPGAPVAALLPPGSLFAAWRKLRQRSGVPLRGLRPSPWLSGPINFLLAVPTFFVGFGLLMFFMLSVQDREYGLAVAYLLGGGALATVVFMLHRGMIGLATRACPSKLPPDLTVRDLIGGIDERPQGGDKALWCRLLRYRLPSPGKSQETSEASASSQMLRDALVSYLREEIWAFEFDRIVQSMNDDDSTLADLSFVLWTLYDDLSDHPIHVLPQEWELLRRLIAALSSGLPLETRHILPIASDSLPPEVAYEPFWSAEQWQQYEPLLDQFDLPEYDAAVQAWRLGVSRDTLTGWSPKHDPRGYTAFMVEPPPIGPASPE